MTCSNLPIPVPGGSGRVALPGIYLVLQPMRFTPPACHHTVAWALTPRFHPCLQWLQRRQNCLTKATTSAVIFCGTCCTPRLRREALLAKKYGALCCPDFPPSLRLGDRTAWLTPQNYALSGKRMLVLRIPETGKRRLRSGSSACFGQGSFSF